MIRLGLRGAAIAAAMLAASGAAADPPASAPVPGTLAVQPDAQEFVARADAKLTFLGDPMRAGGVNLPWMGLRPDLAPPTDYEIVDGLRTAAIFGGGFIRAVSLGLTVGCPDCLVAAPGRLNPRALAHLDHALKLAHDAGMKVIVPLAGVAGCDGNPEVRVLQTACAFARARGKPEAAFYSDPDVRADFLGTVSAVLQHVSAESARALKDDATVMAWENCAGCGTAAPAEAVAEWTQALGQTIKSIDTHHLYENGAFAGRLAGVKPDLAAPPGVDVVGDRLFPAPGADPEGVAAAAAPIAASGHVYLVDEYAWAPANFPTVAALEAYLTAVKDAKAVSGALLQSLWGHADGGGYLAAPASGDPGLTFPGVKTAAAEAADMSERGRAARRFTFRLMRLPAPAFASVKAPEILSAVHGRLTWRGAAGAASYSVFRSDDAAAPNSFSQLCDQCVTDAAPSWQDPNPPTGPAWYRIQPVNINGHIGLPSAPVRNK